jgi:DHA2 family multidrug resistance protein
MSKDGFLSLSKTERFLLTLALGLGTFIQILDSTVTNVSIPFISNDLGVTPNEGIWIITSFSISNAIMIILTGWMAKRVGHVRLFIWSNVLFALFSWFSGIAWNFLALIFFRTLQGISAGSLIPISQTLLILSYPEDKKGVAFGIWGMIVVLAPIFGPVIGGYLTDYYGWPWIFFINIPISLFSAWLTWFMIGDQETEREKIPVDWIGFFLLVTFITSLQIFLDKGNDLNWFHSPIIQILAIGIGLTFCLFMVWNTCSSHPIVNLSFFKERNFTIPTLLSAGSFLMFFGSTVLLPLWLETQLHYSAFLAGLVLMPIGIFPLLFSILVGKYVTQIDPRWMTSLSFICFSITFFWFSFATINVSPYQLMLPRLFQGIAISLFFIPLITIALSNIHHKDLASASGLFSFIRLIAGGGIGTTLYVTLWEQWGAFHYHQLTEKLNLDSLNFSLFPSEKTASVLEQMMAQQAYTLAINELFWMTGWIFLGLAPFIWFCNKLPSSKQSVPPIE